MHLQGYQGQPQRPSHHGQQHLAEDYDEKLKRVIQRVSNCEKIYDETFYTIKEALEKYLQQLAITAARFQARKGTSKITPDEIILALSGDDRAQEYASKKVEERNKNSQK